jgi:hypothetical protein
VRRSDLGRIAVDEEFGAGHEACVAAAKTLNASASGVDESGKLQ